MATYSTGISATWGGVAFAEIVDIGFTYGGSLPKGRSDTWTDDAGSVTLTCFGGVNMNSSEYGLVKSLAISGGGFSLTTDAIYESLSVAPELNGVTRFTATFKILR